MILTRPLNKSQGHSFSYQSISHIRLTYYRLSIVTCSRTHRLATIHSVGHKDDDRQRDATLYHNRDRTKYRRLKTLRHMSRNAIGHRVNGTVPRYSVVVLEESPRHRGPTYKSSSSDFKLLKIFDDMHSADTIY